MTSAFPSEVSRNRRAQTFHDAWPESVDPRDVLVDVSCGLESEMFDVAYAGNVLHHVDIAVTLGEIHPVLRPGGALVSWDPLAHNPLINIYRRMGSPVRTKLSIHYA